MKLRRSALRQGVPLRDRVGRPFHFLLPDPIPEQLHLLDFQAGGRVGTSDPVTNPATREQYYVSSLMEEAISSSQLEGASTTRRVAEEMLRTRRRPQDRSEQMILNNYHAMRHVGEICEEPITPERILALQEMVTAGTLRDPQSAGRLRLPSEEVRVVDSYGQVLHEPPAAEELPERLDDLCRFANGETPGGFLHPIIRSILLHFWLAYDHPFVDGNGRTARTLFYWSARRHGYWLAEFLSISRILHRAPAQYGRAFLHVESDDNDLTYFLLHQVAVLRQAVQDLDDYVTRKVTDLRQAEERLRGMAALNHRQRALITHALRHPQQIYTIQGHRTSHGIVYQTARADLHDLAERGLLERKNRGRAFEYLAVRDLESRLRERLD